MFVLNQLTPPLICYVVTRLESFKIYSIAKFCRCALVLCVRVYPARTGNIYRSIGDALAKRKREIETK